MRAGWKGRDFDLVDPAFLAACRTLLFVDRVAPLLEDAEAVMRTDPLSVPAAERPGLNRARAQAHEQVELMRAALFPKDPSDG